MRSKLHLTLITFLALGTGCVPSFKSAAALDFEELPYESPSGQPWAVRELSLPRTAERFGLPQEPRLSYVELNPGGAPTLLFIHGLGSYLKFWRLQLDAFAAQGYRVLAVDLLGYGKSDKPAAFPYTTEALAEVVAELVAESKAAPVVLVGHSMGGQVAMSYAISRPSELAALVLTSPAGFERFSRKEVAWFRGVMSTAAIRTAGEESIWGSVRRANFMRWRPELEWLIEERVRLAKNKSFDAYAYANVRTVHGLAENGFVRENLEQIRVPTLIVFGDGDRLIPNPFLHGGHTEELMRWGQGRIKGAELTKLEGCGHTVQLDCAEDYNRALGDFLRRHQGALAHGTGEATPRGTEGEAE